MERELKKGMENRKGEEADKREKTREANVEKGEV